MGKNKLGVLLSSLKVVLGNPLLLLQSFVIIIQDAVAKKKIKLSNSRSNFIQEERLATCKIENLR